MDKEKFYNEHIAPELARIGQLCLDNDISMVAAVQYKPRCICETRAKAEEHSWAMELVSLAIAARGNIDALIISIMKLATWRDDLDIGSSIAIQMMRDVP